MNFVVVIVFLFALAFPIGLLIWWKKKTNEKIWCFIAGALCFIIFAYGLEGLLHQVFLYGGSMASMKVIYSPFLFMLYGAFSAGIFEETGRLFGFKILLKKHKEKETAVAYGIGHGGIEVLLLLGMTYLMYILVSLGITIIDAETSQQLLYIASTITPSTAFLAIFERIAAMMIHIGLSMVVFVACNKKGKLWLYVVAICLHAIADMPPCLYQYGIITSIAAIEAFTFFIGAVSLFVGYKALKKYSNPTEALSAETEMIEAAENAEDPEELPV